ncbi:MAG: agmatinase [Phycisphaerae bacterium]
MEQSYKRFLSLPPELSDPAKARYAVLPVPYEGTVSYKPGTAGAPAAIIDASAHVEKLDEELLRECVAPGIATLPAVRPAKTPEAMTARIRRRAEGLIRAGKFLLTLGGEHSIAAPIVAAMAEHHGEISVLQIDAHADLRDSYSGTRRSHGAVMRRILEITPRIAQVGIRSFSKEELDACPKQVRNFITPRDIANDPRWIRRVLKLLGPKVYVTIDIDCFDPAYAPGTGTPEPGGLDWFQVTALLREVCARRKVVGADIVEVRPIPPNHTTEVLAARLAYKIIACTQERL